MIGTLEVTGIDLSWWEKGGSAGGLKKFLPGMYLNAKCFLW